ncbi:MULTISPECIES: aminopeptidase P family protein [unclassified Gemella]|uniref:aminopeptidase P family protein n=1 Tax=unclassified Gemella TaxID=2624949 RepID=UPI0010739C58|nr:MULTISPECIES: aminopeptidase P family protein [unclassified Gemella]MBF0710765.1 aminopeptidase P family protein [Gemella sp. GL1.1]MBF0746666.1 aminopeptidase P family protein [Gemella sp. 19428wG2_WT2a]NYS28109.1 aminopeptidase P family protein [Gemella sp. GL1]TFU60016.1 aminopeptidase P family protein [Gemella sp. WT2a]
MYVNEKLAALRQLMKEKKIDIYLIPTADFHNSENVGDYFKVREYMSGFTGSAGTLVITANYAGLWTDGRYFLQAERELAGTRIELQKMGEEETPSVIDFIVDAIPKGGKLGFDGRVVMYGEGKQLALRLKRKEASLVYDLDLVNEIWLDRPSLSKNKAFSLSLEQAGETVADKLSRVRKEMHSYGANAHIITSLDDTGWLLNIRGTDVEFFPLLLSYTIVYENKVELYVDKSKLSDEIKVNLAKDKVILKDYNQIYKTVKEFEYSDVVLVDPDLLNYAIYNNIPKEVTLVEKRNPTILMKAMKNEVEINNIINAHIKDGVAHTKFIYWLKQLVKSGKISEQNEISASDRLVEFRKAQGDYIFPSFSPIFGHGPNGAVIHYSSTEETNRNLEIGTLLLTDSGSHFMQGSTDITRTHALGEIPLEFKKDYTRVLKANLALSKLKFMEGIAGQNIDILARQHLWENYQNYNHGTGHGVGYIGNIHEGPVNIRWQIPLNGQVEALREGMILSNEPGLYIAGSHGIRLENELLVRKTVKNEFGQFMEFEVITYVPFDLEAIDFSLMTDVDRKELNKYHAKVYELIAPHLTKEEREWLKEVTREI